MNGAGSSRKLGNPVGGASLFARPVFFDGGQSRLRLADTPVVVDDAVSFTTEILPLDGEEQTWTGRISLLADGGERINADYQFMIPP